MKHLTLLLSLPFLLLALVSCDKSTAGWAGTYHFKISGTYKVQLDTLGAGSTHIRYSPNSQFGQLKIISRGNDQYLASFSVVGRDAMVFDAYASHDTLYLKKNNVVISAKECFYNSASGGSSIFTSGVQQPVEMSAFGKKLEGTIVFEVTFSGSGGEGDVKYSIRESDIVCIAEQQF